MKVYKDATIYLTDHSFYSLIRLRLLGITLGWIRTAYETHSFYSIN